MFIVLEGLDGAGTTTQAARLEARLTADERPVHRTFEPSDGPVGRQIRATLRKEPGAPAPWTLPWMYAADRADHLAREVEPALARGEVVVSDRYVPSSLAYQSLQEPLDVVWALNWRFRQPDLVLFVDVPADVALERIGKRGGERELFETKARLEAVRDAYQRVMEFLEHEGWRVVHIDGTPDVDAVERAIWAALESRR